MSVSPGISVVMSAHDEAEAIVGCIASVQELASEIVVVDSGSRDETAVICERLGVRLLRAPNRLMLNENKNLAIDAARHEWVLLLDPDEQVSPDLAAELATIVRDGSACDGFWVPRRDYELGRWLHRASDQLRLFRNGRARFPCAHIHEMVAVQGSLGCLRGVLLHEPRQSLFEYVHKRNLYSEHRARYLSEQGARFRLWRLLLRPPLTFLTSYLFRGYWRDGIQGYLIAASGAYGVFLQDAKLWQREQRVLAEGHSERVPNTPPAGNGAGS